MRNQQQKEITVKTSKGEEFKFGGISEKFTRKLFEWEERKNIAPESSTIALLNSNLYGDSPTSKADIEGKDIDLTCFFYINCITVARSFYHKFENFIDQNGLKIDEIVLFKKIGCFQLMHREFGQTSLNTLVLLLFT